MYGNFVLDMFLRDKHEFTYVHTYMRSSYVLRRIATTCDLRVNDFQDSRFTLRQLGPLPSPTLDKYPHGFAYPCHSPKVYESVNCNLNANLEGCQ